MTASRNQTNSNEQDTTYKINAWLFSKLYYVLVSSGQNLILLRKLHTSQAEVIEFTTGVTVCT